MGNSTCSPPAALNLDIAEDATVEERAAKLNADPMAGTDIDMFLPGHYAYLLPNVVHELVNHFTKKFGHNVAVFMTSRTLTIVPPKPYRRLQFALGTAKSFYDVILNADVDCASVGFDGRDVWMTGRGYLSWRYRMNVPQHDLHRIRGSPTYEKRLLKYAHRGFAVLNIDVPANDEKVLQAVKALGANPRLQQLKGLLWLLAVDRTSAEAKLANTNDALTYWDEAPDSATIDELVEKVIARGYAESDNYGQHEEGYIVCLAPGSPHEAKIDDYQVLHREKMFAYSEITSLEATRFNAQPWLIGIDENAALPAGEYDENDEEYD